MPTSPDIRESVRQQVTSSGPPIAISSAEVEELLELCEVHRFQNDRDEFRRGLDKLLDRLVQNHADAEGD